MSQEFTKAVTWRYFLSISWLFSFSPYASLSMYVYDWDNKYIVFPSWRLHYVEHQDYKDTFKNIICNCHIIFKRTPQFIIIGHLNCFQFFVRKRKLWWPSAHNVLKTLSEWVFTQIFDWISGYFFRISLISENTSQGYEKLYVLNIYCQLAFQKDCTNVHSFQCSMRLVILLHCKEKNIANLETKRDEECMPF